MIPQVIVRTVPQETSGEVEAFWSRIADIHHGWELITYRDPLDPADFPLSAHLWPRCQNGAQFAGLIRLEALWHHGGVYLDSDMEMFRSVEPLRGVQVFAAWEDPNTVPDAVIGAEPGHPAIKACLDLATKRILSDSTDWRTGNGAWSTGPGVTTTVFRRRDDVLLLPPGTFYPVHYTDKASASWATVQTDHPWAYGAHRWHASWLPG
jgi:mannosyltransferase OCH1-like enzyme